MDTPSLQLLLCTEGCKGAMEVGELGHLLWDFDVSLVSEKLWNLPVLPLSLFSSSLPSYLLSIFPFVLLSCLPLSFPILFFLLYYKEQRATQVFYINI